MESELLAHVLEVVRAAPLRHQPFDHLYFERVFPPAFYAELLAAIPDPEHFEPLYHKDALRADGTTTRSTFTLEPEALARLPERARGCLEVCRSVFGSQPVREALTRPLRGGAARALPRRTPRCRRWRAR